MTGNQIAYVKHLEDVRHNQAYEGETYRHNVQQENIGFQQASAAASQAAASHAQARAALQQADTQAKKVAYDQWLGPQQLAVNQRDAATREYAAQQQNNYWDTKLWIEGIKGAIETGFSAAALL